MSRQKTLKEKVRATLAEAGDDGLSKSELARRTGVERGHLRGILNSMMIDGEVMVEREAGKYGNVARCILVTGATDADS